MTTMLFLMIKRAVTRLATRVGVLKGACVDMMFLSSVRRGPRRLVAAAMNTSGRCVALPLRVLLAAISTRVRVI